MADGHPIANLTAPRETGPGFFFHDFLGVMAMFQANKLLAVYNIGSCELLTGWMSWREADMAAQEAEESDGQPEVKLVRLDAWIETHKPTTDDSERRAWIASNAGRPLSILNGVIDSWHGFYPVVDADGDLTGETIEANDHSQFGKYEVAPCGMAVIEKSA